MALEPDLGSFNATRLGVCALTPHQRLTRWTVLGLCSAPLIGSFFYRSGYRLPFLQCPLRSLIGIPCPTCGMTHSFVALVQGDVFQAVQYHLFGPAVFLLFLTTAIHILWELKLNRKRAIFYKVLFAKPIAYCGAIGAYFGYYAVRLYCIESTGELYHTFWASPLGVWMSQV
jgi:Protein of unknown function (DUF2752)